MGKQEASRSLWRGSLLYQYHQQKHQIQDLTILLINHQGYKLFRFTSPIEKPTVSAHLEISTLLLQKFKPGERMTKFFNLSCMIKLVAQYPSLTSLFVNCCVDSKTIGNI